MKELSHCFILKIKLLNFRDRPDEVFSWTTFSKLPELPFLFLGGNFNYLTFNFYFALGVLWRFIVQQKYQKAVVINVKVFRFLFFNEHWIVGNTCIHYLLILKTICYFFSRKVQDFWFTPILYAYYLLLLFVLNTVAHYLFKLFNFLNKNKFRNKIKLK